MFESGDLLNKERAIKETTDKIAMLKTDFKARCKMVSQDRNRFNNRKYRLIVHITNKRCICQVAYATIRGDMTVTSTTYTGLMTHGDSQELRCVLCHWPEVARWCLKKFGLGEMFKGKEEIDGDDYHVEEENDQRPLKVI